MLYEIFLLVAVLCSVKCSIVIEADSQKGIYISDYCPKMKYCPEGAHVMCMYYNPNSVMGPRCRNFQNVSMTTELANKLLDVANAVRSKIARGKEKGKNGELLPRGYGIFRLRWDSELATFAQVLSNQCVLRHDLCRATKKFPEPGQTAGLVRFTVPDWIPVSKAGNFTSRGLDNEKLLYATTQTLKSWYGQKGSITPQMVTSYPNWTKDPNNQNGRLYMEMIYGPATHMGCGIAAYREYAFYDNDSPLNYNSVQVICNFSARPRTGTAVFNTVPPSDTESPFNPCGCPAGSIEDDDCLCLEVAHIPEPLPVVHQKDSCPPGVNCDPTVVLLPIFTVEDAPPNKLVSSGFGNSSAARTQHEMAAPDSFEQLFDNNLSGNKGILHQSRKTIELPAHGIIGQKQRPTLHSGVTIRNRHFDLPRENINHNRITRYDPPSDTKDHTRRNYDHDSKEHNNIVIRNRNYEAPNGHIIIRSRHYDPPHDAKDHRENELKHKQVQRSSVFSKTPIFELPGSHYFLTTRKRDVVPRKDFSTGKQLVNKYLYSKNSIPIITPKEHSKFHSHENVVIEVKSVETVRLNDDHTLIKPKEHKSFVEHPVEDVNFHDILTTESNLNTAEQNVMNHNKEIVVLNLSQDYDKLDEKKQVANAVDDKDKKLMALLDTLEQEVKHIELHDKEKEMFDAKIKKIYGKVVGRGSNDLTATVKPQIVTTTPLIDLSNKIDNEVHNLPPSFDTADDESNFIDDPNYRKHDTDIDFDDKRDITDVDIDDLERPVIAKTKPRIPYDIKPKYTRRSKNNVRNRNQLDSLEFTKQRYDHDYKNRKSYKSTYRNEMGKLKHRSNNLDYRRKNYYVDAYEDPLSIERRKYYQDKLDSMERKLQNARRYSNRRKELGRSPHMRAMKPSLRSDNQMNPLYAGRARILHGY